MISAQNLKFAYPNATADTLNGIDFDIAEKEIFGFLGPSGSGKSTTQKILIGLLKDYRGEISILGKDLKSWGNELYEHIGVSFELPNHYLKLTARENLQHFAGFYQGPTLTPDEVLEMVDLHMDADKKVSDFSKGMKIRLNVARSLLHKPKILFLDEPTSGLDPVNGKRIKDLILGLRDAGTTVFVTTHNMNLADELCDRVAFVTAGNISVIDAPDALKKQYGQRKVRLDVSNQHGDLTSTHFELDGLQTNAQFHEAVKAAHRIERIHSQETTLDNIFIQVTGRELTA
ncbi:ATP-binding cassette domain-containing protein [Maritalea sp.]|uniref:ABC transporter ATP-binding protein n=1 Tax=Maritalea sp. TaxID=2003361 RepID=UPI003EF9A81F